MDNGVPLVVPQQHKSALFGSPPFLKPEQYEASPSLSHRRWGLLRLAELPPNFYTNLRCSVDTHLTAATTTFSTCHTGREPFWRLWINVLPSLKLLKESCHSIPLGLPPANTTYFLHDLQ